MAMFPFFRQNKPRQFDYRPRFFDPEAEAREKRKREVLGENYMENYYPKEECPKKNSSDLDDDYIPGRYLQDLRIRRGIIADRRAQEKKRMTMTRIILFIVLLALVVWWLYF